MNKTLPTAQTLGLHRCGLCTRVFEQHRLRCPRCDTPAQHLTGRASLSRTWAYTLAAIALYVPANLLPIMTTKSVLGRDAHTILGGIHALWLEGDWFLASVVFIASVAVPVLKLLILLLLAITAQRQSSWRSLERARLYRCVQAVGHWSMLDVFVVLMLVGMIRFGPFAGVEPEGGLLAFGAMVIATMLATISFDPRLLWPPCPVDLRFKND